MINKILLLVVISFGFFSCDYSTGQNQQAGETQSKPVNEEKLLLNPDEFDELQKQNQEANLLDIRTDMEVKKGYIAGMSQVDWFRDDFHRVVENRFSKDKPLFVYCGIGGRSATCVEQLREAGFKKVYDLDGGFRAWEKAGKAVEK